MAVPSLRLSCAVCVGTKHEDNWQALRCGHAFHASCLGLWLRQHRDCPCCRAKLSGKQFPVALYGSGCWCSEDGHGDSGPAPQGDTSDPELLRQTAQMVQVLNQTTAQCESLTEQLTRAQHKHDSIARKHDHLVACLDRTTQEAALLREQALAREQELTRLRDRCRTEMARREQREQELARKDAELARVRSQHVDELLQREKALRRAEAGLRLAKLANPGLAAADVQQLLSGCGPEDSPDEASQQVAQLLIARNAELQAAQAAVRQLQAELREAHGAAAAQCDAAHRQWRAQVEALEKEADAAKREVVLLDYKLEKAQKDLQAQGAELGELRSVLVAMQGRSPPVAAARQGAADGALQQAPRARCGFVARGSSTASGSGASALTGPGTSRRVPPQQEPTVSQPGDSHPPTTQPRTRLWAEAQQACSAGGSDADGVQPPIQGTVGAVTTGSGERSPLVPMRFGKRLGFLRGLGSASGPVTGSATLLQGGGQRRTEAAAGILVREGPNGLGGNERRLLTPPEDASTRPSGLGGLKRGPGWSAGTTVSFKRTRLFGAAAKRAAAAGGCPPVDSFFRKAAPPL